MAIDDHSASTWPSLAIIAGGLLMAVLWFRYITLHGPTYLR